MSTSLEFLQNCLAYDKEFALITPPLNEAIQRTAQQFILRNGTLMSVDGSKLSLQPFPDAAQKAAELSDQRAHYLSITQKAIDTIKAQALRKVVLARTKIVDGVSRQSLVSWYDRLVDRYPEAFVFALSTKKSGVWIGASPELLVEKRAGAFRTIALAATSASPEPHWTAKDYDEHAHVTSYICNTLKGAGVNDVTFDGPRPCHYGRLTHLKTDIAFASNLTLCDLVALLHPTPALCGYPKNKALRFIHMHEPFQREFYTGSIAIEGVDGDGAAFAFLRCAKFTGNARLTFYAGCGIVGASVPQREWDESEAKIDSILNELPHP